jgi:hypothetical protein
MSALRANAAFTSFCRRYRLARTLTMVATGGVGFALSSIAKEARSSVMLLAVVSICTAALLGYAKRVSP